MDNNIFSLVTYDNNKVVVKIDITDNLQIALNPYISGDMDYITVTRGEKHILTVIRKDGTTFSFNWGIGGHTLISENLKLLKLKIIEFIETECKIPLDYDGGKVTSVSVYYNTNYKSWQVSFDIEHKPTVVVFNKDIVDRETMFIFAEEIMKRPCNFVEGTVYYGDTKNFYL